MIDISFINETTADTAAYETLITTVFESVMEEESRSEYTEVSVIFVTDDHIQQINRDYRGKDQVTDVISFALQDSEEEIIGLDIPTLGDIFICVDQAKRQAQDYGHSFDREMGFLACHGLLHLLGYDHMTQEEETLMFGKQEAILNTINLTRGGGINDQ